MQLAASMLGEKGYNALKMHLIRMAMTSCEEKLVEMSMPDDTVELFREVMEFVAASEALPLDQLTEIKGYTEKMATFAEEHVILGLELDPDGHPVPKVDTKAEMLLQALEMADEVWFLAQSTNLTWFRERKKKRRQQWTRGSRR